MEKIDNIKKLYEELFDLLSLDKINDNIINEIIKKHKEIYILLLNKKYKNLEKSS